MTLRWRRLERSSSFLICTRSGMSLWPRILLAFLVRVKIAFLLGRCGPCKLIAPKIEALAAEMTDVVFLKLDCNQMNKVRNVHGQQATAMLWLTRTINKNTNGPATNLPVGLTCNKLCTNACSMCTFYLVVVACYGLP